MQSDIVFDGVTNMYRLVMVGMRHIDGGVLYNQILATKNDKWLFSIKAEPENKFDPKAIAVYAYRDYEVPSKVGYLKKEHAALLYKAQPMLQFKRVLALKATNFNTYYAVLHVPLLNFQTAPLVEMTTDRKSVV